MAKTQTQIQDAQTLLKLVQDYITLASVEKKLKMEENVSCVSEQLEQTTEAIQDLASKI